MLKGIKKGDDVVIRSRREVVQHAGAFQLIVDHFVKHSENMTEELLKETHRILTNGMDPADSGNFGIKPFGGTYRQGNEKAFAGAHEFTKPSQIAKSMKKMVLDLNEDIALIENNKKLDPFMLAAKYCDRFVHIHPFKDGNGRMCRLVLNSILIRYAGVVINLGEKGEDRDLYIEIAQESNKVESHAGQLAKMVLEIAEGTLRRLKITMGRKTKISSSN